MTDKQKFKKIIEVNASKKNKFSEIQAKSLRENLVKRKTQIRSRLNKK
mgnify:CR=1 FL=1|tara:strand:+ start:76 stop:219 length:144 start_codon:yes stop_codon:yes gene_type:complete